MNDQHDRLQSECFLWFWNTYPEYRRLLFAVPNEQKLLGFVPRNMRPAILARLKSIGLVPGVYDLLLYRGGTMYGFDVKVGRDKLSDNQKKFQDQVTAQGGRCFTVSSLVEFQTLITQILHA